MGDLFHKGDRVYHMDAPAALGTVRKDERRGDVRVDWDETEEWPGIRLTVPAAELRYAYPVCEGCGTRHRELSQPEALEAMKNLALTEAVKVVMAAKPGTYPGLELALTAAAGLEQRSHIDAEVEKFAAALAEAPSAEEPER